MSSADRDERDLDAAVDAAVAALLVVPEARLALGRVEDELVDLIGRAAGLRRLGVRHDLVEDPVLECLHLLRGRVLRRVGGLPAAVDEALDPVERARCLARLAVGLRDDGGDDLFAGRLVGDGLQRGLGGALGSAAGQDVAQLRRHATDDAGSYGLSPRQEDHLQIVNTTPGG